MKDQTEIVLTEACPASRANWRALDYFTRAYLTAVFWTNDEQAPGGMDYRDTGRADDFFASLSAEALEMAKRDCEKFQTENAEVLELSEQDPEQSGHDFWLTRCRHGAGFWDRDLPADTGKKLTAAAHAFGELCFYQGDDGKFYFSR